MQIKRRRSRTGHRGCNLLRDDSGFSDTEKDNFAFAFGQQFDDALDLVVIEASSGLGNRVRFDTKKIDDFRKIGFRGHAGTLIQEFAKDLQASGPFSICQYLFSIWAFVMGFRAKISDPRVVSWFRWSSL